MVKRTEEVLHNTIVLAKDNGNMTREQVIDLLRTALEKPPSTILALYTLWDPNKFDGKDSNYVNALGYDKTGWFIPYIVRAEGMIIQEPLLDYETEGA